MSSDRIIHWRLLLEEYGPEYVHIKGKDNIVANALSRMDAEFNPDVKATVKDHSECTYICAYTVSHLIRDESCEIPDPNDPEATASTFLLESEIEENKFLMNPTLIQKKQEQDKKLQQDIQKNVEKYRK
jgi:hypothetical protein